MLTATALFWSAILLCLHANDSWYSADMPPKQNRAIRYQAKLKRIRTVIGSGGISDSCLARVVSKVKKAPALLADISSRHVLKRYSKKLIQRISQTETLRLDDGTDFIWKTACLRKMLQYLAEQYEPFRKLLRATYQKHKGSPDAPWRLILAEDELTPGAVLRLNNKRKTLAHYCTIKEFGSRHRRTTAAWMPLAFLRSDVIKKVEGSVSAVQRVLLRRLLIHADSVRRQGVVLPIGSNDSPVLVFITLGSLISDEAAVKAFWGSVGAAGLMPCLHCKNVTAFGGRGLSGHTESGYLVDVSCHDASRFDAQSSEEVFEKCDILTELKRTANKTEFSEAQKRFGIKYSPFGVLFDEELRPFVGPAEVNCYDGAHTLLCDGLVQTEMTLLMKRTRGVIFSKIQTLLDSEWSTCKAIFSTQTITQSLKNCFNASREQYFKDNKKLLEVQARC